MFRKLLKYEWRANARLFWILSLAALGVAVLGGGAMWGANYFVETSTNDMAIALVAPGMYMLTMFCGLALMGYMTAVEIINLVRFYKSRFTDEGYLTFTLPVKANEIYLSTYVNMLLWMLIAGAIMIGCFVLMFVIGMGDTVRDWMSEPDFWMIWKEITAAFGQLQGEMESTKGFGLYTALMVIMMVLSPLYAISMIMGCLTLGSVLAKKHKILASIGIYYGISMVTSTVTSSLSGIFTLGSLDSESFFIAYNQTFIAQIVVMIGIIVGSYFLSTYLMKNKLNLP